MYPLITISSLTIGTYGLCCVFGGLLALLIALWNCKRSGVNRYDMIEAAALIIVGALIGAKLLYLIVDYDTVISMFRIYGVNSDTLLNAIQGGFVFYGGFFGGLLAAFLYAKSQKKSLWLYLMTIAPAIPLAHAFGRVGCFMAGCCYGIPSETYGIAFTQSLGAPNGIKLFPVQLLEAALLLILALIMQIFYQRTKHLHCVIYLYLFLYPIIRIITEQFRYDDAQRGVYFGLSTSTWISIGIFVTGLILLIRDWKKGFPEPDAPVYPNLQAAS
jgi:phosphatidylglycerol:prolipoprotein diacylglycerol transferase